MECEKNWGKLQFILDLYFVSEATLRVMLCIPLKNIQNITIFLDSGLL